MTIENQLSPFMQELKPYLEKEGYTLKEQLSRTDSYSGSNSIAWRVEKDNEDSVLRIMSGDPRTVINSDNLEKLEEFVERERTVLGQIGNHPSIPSLRRAFNVSYGPSGIQTAYCTEIDLIRAPSIAEIIASGKRLSEKEAKMLLKDDTGALGEVHALGGMHRDVRPENVYLNGERAYISDFGLVTLDGKDRGTFMIYAPYYPLDFFMGNKSEHDLVALGNVAISAGHGKTIDQLRNEQEIDAHQKLDVSRLPYSEDLRGFLDKLTEEPSRRYKDAKSTLKDLERIVNGSLPVQVQSSPQLRKQTSSPHDLTQYEGKGFYEVAKNIMQNFELSDEEKEEIMRRNTSGDHMLQLMRAREQEAKYAALREAAEHYGIEGGVEDEVRSLRKPFLGMLDRKGMREYRKKSRELEKILSSGNFTDLNSFSGTAMGAMIGNISSIGYPLLGLHAAYPPPFIIGNLMLGAIAGKNIGQYLAKRKLVFRARELDSWLTESGYFPRESEEEQTAVTQAGNLEDVVLSGEEKRTISNQSADVGFITGASTLLICTLGGAIVGAHGNSIDGAITGMAVGAIIGSPAGLGMYHARYLELKHRLLNAKRRALGYPEEKGLVGKAVEWVDDRTLKMNWKGEETYTIREMDDSREYVDNFKRALDSYREAKKVKHLPSADHYVTGDDFLISYHLDFYYLENYSYNPLGITARIKAKTQKRAEEILSNLKQNARERSRPNLTRAKLAKQNDESNDGINS